MKHESINDDFENALDLLIPAVRNRSNTLFTIVNELEKESDRGCALVAAAYLENEITALLESFLVKQDKNANKELFDFNGPLGTFSSKIKISFALGLISKESRTSLNVIRKIRNDFAHLQTPLNFDDRDIQQKINTLLPSYNVSEMPYREKFIKKVQALVAVIHFSIANTFNQDELKHVNVVLMDNQDEHELEIAARRIMKITAHEITYEQALKMAQEMKDIN